MKRKSSSSFIVIPLIFLFGLVVGYYYANLNIKMIVSTNKDSLTPSPSVTTKNTSYLQTVEGKQQYTSSSRKIKFYVLLPSDWSVTRDENSEDGMYLEISKGDYVLTIFDPPHGSVCTYEGEKKYEGPSEHFDTYQTLNTNFGTFRMGRNPKELYAPTSVVFRGCSLISSFYPTANYETGTLIGHIEYHVPYNYSQTVINEMNTLLKQIQLSKNY